MLLIFDFDGTIADTKALYYNAIYKNVKRFGYSYEDVDKVIDMGENLKKVLRRLGLKGLMIMVMKRKIMKDVLAELPNVHKCRDVESIKELEQEKILVTNSLKSAVLPLLNHFNLKKEFKEVYGFEDFADKGEFLKGYIKERKLNPKECFYMGDRASDVRVARKAGCNSVIITGNCAWDSAKEIIEENPDFLIHSIRDLKVVLK